MKKEMSRSRVLIASMHRAALSALSEAPGGRMKQGDLMRAIESLVPLDEWAVETYETTGNVRWRSIFAFASVGLVKAQYVVKERGVWSITERGRSAIAGIFEPERFLLETDRLYREWKTSQIDSPPLLRPTLSGGEEGDDVLELPDDRITKILRAAHEALAADLVDTIKKCDAEFFEKLVVKLLLKMGYGGSRQEAGEAVGRSGDGGIDGIINEDRLGLDAIYLQAKRWEGSVGEGPIRDFKGALDAKGAQKGVFITTSTFTPAAKDAARNSRSYRIVLIDGARLADLMIEHDLGVSVAATYQLKRIDSDFFADE
jgi:restriction system protein